MELDELKASWKHLDKRLAESEIVNLRIVKEMISQKTKSAYDRIYGLNLYNLVVTAVMTAVVFPWIYMHTPISPVSFAIVEVVMVLGMIPQIWKLNLLSRFDLQHKRCNELNRLVLHYKQARQREVVWGITSVSLAMVAFYISELGFNKQAGYVLGTRILLPLGLSLLTFAFAYVVARWQWRRHATQMEEIERGLDELKEFES